MSRRTKVRTMSMKEEAAVIAAEEQVHENQWIAKEMKVQLYLPGGMSMYECFPWDTTVRMMKDEVWGQAEQASASAGVKLGRFSRYTLKVSSRLQGFQGSLILDNESISVSDAPCLAFCREHHVVPKIALVKKSRPTSAAELSEQLLKEQVAALVGVDFSDVDDEEIKKFRSSMAKFRSQCKEEQTKAMAQGLRASLVYQIPISLTSPIPPTLPDFFVVRVRMPGSEVTNTVRVDSAVDSVDDTVLKAYNKFSLRNLVPDGKTAQDYIFKVTGYEEFLFGSELTIAFDCVRSRLKKQQEVVLSLWDTERYKLSMAQRKTSGSAGGQSDDELMGRCPWNQHFDPNYQRHFFHNSETGETKWEDPRQEWLQTERMMLRRGDTLRSEMSSGATFDDSVEGGLSDALGSMNMSKRGSMSNKRVSMPSLSPDEVLDDVDMIEAMEMEELVDGDSGMIINSNRLFRVQVVGCDQVYEASKGGFERFMDKFKEKESDKDIKFDDVRIYVEVAVCFGGEQIGAPKRTCMQSIKSSPRWNEWLTFDSIELRDMPVGARLCSTLWGEVTEKDKQRRVPVAWVNLAMMDRLHHMHQGIIAQRMFPDDECNPLGTTAENYTDLGAALVFFEFDTYASHLRFPNYSEQIALGHEIRDAPTPKIRHGVEREILSTDRGILKRTIMKHPLEKLTMEEKSLLWQAREELVKESKALPKFLRSVMWSNRKCVAETYVLMELWNPPPPLDALELLSVKYADPEVRRYAIECLEGKPLPSHNQYTRPPGLTDSELVDLLPQMVQVLKSEPHLDSYLAKFLLGRGIRNPFKVGHILFWQLKAEMHVPETSQRFGLLLEEFAKALSPEYRAILRTECDVLSRLLQISIDVTEIETKNERNDVARQKLREVPLPDHFIMPLDSKWAASGLVIEKCRAMDSKKVPLWLTFKNADPEGEPLVTMLKYGDDLRQDIVTLQMIRIMDKLWEQNGLELRLNTYGVSATGDNEGMLEIVLNSITYAGITEKAGGAMEMFNNKRVANWLKSENPTEQSYAEAVDNFIYSAAGYCVATYVLGIGDRHDDNIMLTKIGHLFHIDFGHFLGHFKDFKKIPGIKIKRERTPFVFTPDWAYVMGGLKGQNFEKFQRICCEAYLILRRNASLFINMFAMMLSTGIPELTDETDIQYMIDVLMLDSSDDEACKHLRKLIKDGHDNKFKQIDGVFHILAHK